ncbi:MAG: hypothetical protein Q9165_006393 [Trypethelium subeluteriae]
MASTHKLAIAAAAFLQVPIPEHKRVPNSIIDSYVDLRLIIEHKCATTSVLYSNTDDWQQYKCTSITLVDSYYDDLQRIFQHECASANILDPQPVLDQLCATAPINNSQCDWANPQQYECTSPTLIDSHFDDPKPILKHERAAALVFGP